MKDGKEAPLESEAEVVTLVVKQDVVAKELWLNLIKLGLV